VSISVEMIRMISSIVGNAGKPTLALMIDQMRQRAQFKQNHYVFLFIVNSNENYVNFYIEWIDHSIGASKIEHSLTFYFLPFVPITHLALCLGLRLYDTIDDTFQFRALSIHIPFQSFYLPIQPLYFRVKIILLLNLPFGPLVLSGLLL
jgi:hypothetical protein